MLANDAAASATNAYGEAAEDEIVKINEAGGMDLFEGDMRLSSEEYNVAYGKAKGKRNVQLDRRFSWRTRIIPYRIDHSTSECSFSRSRLATILFILSLSYAFLAYEPGTLID